MAVQLRESFESLKDWHQFLLNSSDQELSDIEQGYRTLIREHLDRIRQIRESRETAEEAANGVITVTSATPEHLDNLWMAEDVHRTRIRHLQDDLAIIEKLNNDRLQSYLETKPTQEERFTS